MKKIFSLAVVMAALFALISCEPKNEDVTGLTLDKKQATIQVGKTLQLVATLAPEGAEGNVKWESSNLDVATVENGLVTAVAKGNAYIAASCGEFSATCLVTVVEAGATELDYASLKGSEYYVIAMDDETFEQIKDNVVADFRVNDEQNRFFYCWDKQSVSGNTTGKNFYGKNADWFSITNGNLGWTGWGQCLPEKVGPDGGEKVSVAETQLPLINKLAKMFENPEEYYFHIAIKSVDNTPRMFCFEGNGAYNGVRAGIVIGAKTYPDGNPVVTYSYAAAQDYTYDGEWYEIEVPLTDLINNGVGDKWAGQKWGWSELTEMAGDFNVFCFFGGPVAGKNFQWDAAFFYKK